MEIDTSRWSGEGEFTALLVERLQQVPEIAVIRVEDAPSTRSEADYNFISNEVYVAFCSGGASTTKPSLRVLARFANRD